MSITKRIVSGSAASWSQIGITVLTQIILVPVYLSYWDSETYGVWLAIQALLGIITTLDLGHQLFLGYEFLRLGRNRATQVSVVLWSGVKLGLGIGLLQVALIIGFLSTGFFKDFIAETGKIDIKLVTSAGIVLLIQGVIWLFTGSAGGILVRALSAFGYYPRLAWWGVFSSAITAVAPAISVALGGDFLFAGIAYGLSTILFNIFLYKDMIKLIRKENLGFFKGSLRRGWGSFVKSLGVSLRNLLENIRIGGVRVILSPIVGAQGLSNFSTVRTGANFAMQGLNSITYPLMPELMKFLNERDQARSETAFGTIWIVILIFLAPAVILLQTFVEPFFDLWTRGKIPFDPLLFGLLSIGVLVYALAQPATAVVTGNNLLRHQVLLSAVSAAIVIGGTLFLVPKYGIDGAGMALLAAEILSALGYKYTAQKWLTENDLTWPKTAFLIASTSIWITAIGISLIVYFPEHKVVLAVCCLALLWANLFRYWKALPIFARQRVNIMIRRIPLISKSMGSQAKQTQ